MLWRQKVSSYRNISDQFHSLREELLKDRYEVDYQTLNLSTSLELAFWTM